MGRIAGEVMVRQHRPETAWTLHLLDIQPTDTVLEVGFGAGQGIKLAAERVTSGRIRGIDLSEEMVRVATKRNASAIKAGRVALSQGSITALPFECKSQHETGAFPTSILVGKQLQRPLLTRIGVGFSPEYCWDLQTGQPCGVTFGQCGSPRRGGSRLALESGR